MDDDSEVKITLTDIVTGKVFTYDYHNIRFITRQQLQVIVDGLGLSDFEQYVPRPVTIKTTNSDEVMLSEICPANVGPESSSYLLPKLTNFEFIKLVEMHKQKNKSK